MARKDRCIMCARVAGLYITAGRNALYANNRLRIKRGERRLVCKNHIKLLGIATWKAK